MSRFAEALLDKLRASIPPAAPTLPTRIADAQARLAAAPDLDAGLAATVALIIATEDVAGAAQALAAEARGALRFALEESGAGNIDTDFHTATLQRGRRTVVVTDMDAIPPDFVLHEPKPDRSKILAADKLNIRVPGTEVSNGASFLTIRARST